MSTKKNKQEEFLEQTGEIAGEETPVMGVAVSEETEAEDTAALQEGETEIDSTKPVKFVVNYPHGLNLRIGPGRNFAVKRVLPNGSIVEGVGEVVRAGNVDWVPLNDGWVDGTYLLLAGEE